MIIASQKRRENIAEYLLYMWQVEDMIRANDCNLDRIVESVVGRFPDLSEEQRREMIQWYDSLIDMMRREDVTSGGHLQINKNVLASITELHVALLNDPRFDDYKAEFYRTLPFVVELRARSGAEMKDEIETCFNALYGILMLRLSGKEISRQTADALAQISRFIATLAAYFKKNEAEPLFEPKTV